MGRPTPISRLAGKVGHRGTVVLAVFMDGHVAPIYKNTPAVIVKRWAMRDDAQYLGPDE
jgi:hypothetical protein